MNTSLPSRKIKARKPSHFGSKIQLPVVGSSATRFASIGKTGGFTGSCMRPSYVLNIRVQRPAGTFPVTVIEVNPRTLSVKREAEEGLFLETRDIPDNGAWIHRSYLKRIKN